MRLSSLLVTLLALLLSRPAQGAENWLAWDDCRGGAGVLSKRFSCDTNTGSHAFIVSSTAPPSIESWIAFEIELSVDATPRTFPPWWQLRGTGQCRNGALSANSGASGLSGCTDPYRGLGNGGIGSYFPGYYAPGRARMTMVFAVPSGNEIPLIEGEEYFVARVVINNSKTTSCSGCDVPLCIEPVYVRYVQPSGSPGGNVTVGQGWNWNTDHIVWQADWQPGNDCEPCGISSASSYSICSVCPAQNLTWGRIKSIYR